MHDLFPLLMLFLVGIFVANLISVYNLLNPLREELREAEGNIEIVMHKVMELTDKLVDIAKQYGFHEKNIFMDIAKLQKNQRQAYFKQSISTMVSVADYAQTFPLLKADGTYLKLMSDLDRLSAEAQSKYEQYNSRAKIYNTKRTEFPTILTSSAIGFTKASYLNPNRWFPSKTQTT